MKRTLLLGSAWTASAAAAVGLGFLAVSLVDASASTPSQALESSVSTLSADDSSSASSASPSPVSGSPVPVAAGQQVTAGGTVYGSCDGGAPVLASAPAAGWWLDDSNDAGKVEFQNGAQRVEVRATCVDGVARFSVEGPRADNSGSGSHSGSGSGSSGDDSRSTAPAPAATTSSSVDDSAGRTGGGHGADDGVRSTPSAATLEPGDDSGGHGGGGGGGGGHGSDG